MFLLSYPHSSERLFESATNFEAKLADYHEKRTIALDYLLLDLADNCLFVERLRVENEF